MANNKAHFENFFLPADFMSAAAPAEIDATFEAMHESEIDRAPFTEFYITCPEHCLIETTKDGEIIPPERLDQIIEFHYADMKDRLGHVDGIVKTNKLKVTSWCVKKYLDWF